MLHRLLRHATAANARPATICQLLALGTVALFCAQAAIANPPVATAPVVPMIDLTTLRPAPILRLLYATADNFVGEPLYPDAVAYLAEPAARALARANADLASQGFALVIWDAYRPLSVQRRLWEKRPDPELVADPKTGSRHNRGCAVDLTLARLDGSEVAMPTAYDEVSSFTPARAPGLTPEVFANRTRLQKAMLRQGFKLLNSEWWHFDFPGWDRMPLLDLSFAALASAAARHPAAAAR